MINNSFIKNLQQFTKIISPNNLDYLDAINQQSSLTSNDSQNTKLVIEAINLINQYILYGYSYIPHLLNQNQYIASPQISTSDKTVNLNGYLGYQTISLKDLLLDLKNKYSNKIGYQFNHISDISHINFILNLINKYQNFEIKNNYKIKIYNTLLESDLFEDFIIKKYPLSKFFLGKGLETSNIILQTIIDSTEGIKNKNLFIAMAHRNRLNIVHNILKKPFSYLFKDLNDEEIIQGKAGDVKYHQGYKTTLNNINLELLPNPSHLESINTVLLGYLKANKDSNNNSEGVIFHGDSSFSSLGAVQESLSLNNLKGYNYNGVIHIILNNQLGFTAKINKEYKDPTYAAKISDSLILNVSANEVEEIYKATLIALDYKKFTNKDVFINLIGYRKLGHNEGDEPRYTNPIYYSKIENQESYFQSYTKQLINSNILSQKDNITNIDNFNNLLHQSFNKKNSFSNANNSIKDNKTNSYSTIQISNINPKLSYLINSINQDTFQLLFKKIYNYPANFNINIKLKDILQKRINQTLDNSLIDYSLAEMLAFAFLLLNNQNVRLSGEDSQRGTFSNRHSVLIDEYEETEYTPLNNLSKNQGFFTSLNSPISEYGVLGYEFGYSIHSVTKNDLVIWEAQFGDFLNNAQVIVDNYIASCYQKWGLSSNLVIYLPHALEGQGHEHSSCRLERLLQLASQNNFQIINPTTSHNLFYTLINQPFQKQPLFILTPKSYLRSLELSSNIKDFVDTKKFIPLHTYSKNLDSNIQNLIICHGKFSFILKSYIKENNLSNYLILTLDQIYPFPTDDFLKIIANYPNLLNIIVAQEEPSNMGIISYMNNVFNHLQKNTNIHCKNINYIGRKETSAIATYSQKTHQYEEKELLSLIFKR